MTKKEIRDWLLTIPIMLEIYRAFFLRGNNMASEPVFQKEHTIRTGTLGVDLRSGYVYFPGETLPDDDDVVVVEKGQTIGVAQVLSEKCGKPFVLRRGYRLADIFFETPLMVQRTWEVQEDLDSTKKRKDEENRRHWRATGIWQSEITESLIWSENVAYDELADRFVLDLRQINKLADAELLHDVVYGEKMREQQYYEWSTEISETE